MKNIEKNIKLTMNTFSLIFKYSPSYLLLLLFRVITSMSLSLVYVYIPKLIIEAITIHSDYFYTLKTILFFGVTVVVFQLCDHFINKKQQDSTEKISLELTKEVGQIVMDLSMYEIESTEEKDNIVVEKVYKKNIVAPIGKDSVVGYIEFKSENNITRFDLLSKDQIAVISPVIEEQLFYNSSPFALYCRSISLTDLIGVPTNTAYIHYENFCKEHNESLKNMLKRLDEELEEQKLKLIEENKGK